MGGDKTMYTKEHSLRLVPIWHTHWLMFALILMPNIATCQTLRMWQFLSRMLKGRTQLWLTKLCLNHVCIFLHHKGLGSTYTARANCQGILCRALIEIISYKKKRYITHYCSTYTVTDDALTAMHHCHTEVISYTIY